ncbi:hypothetical protein JCM10296v2_003957 [Rhodotorula toruloides]
MLSWWKRTTPEGPRIQQLRGAHNNGAIRQATNPSTTTTPSSSPELIAPLSEFMGRDVLLIRKGLTRRSVKEVPGVVHSEGLDPVLGFADDYAFLISSATSLKYV